MSVDVDHGQRHRLRTQVQELLEQLNDTERALAHHALDERLRERVAVPFQRLLGTRRDEVLALRADLERGRDVRDAWRELQDIRAATGPLFAESLALLEGGLVRGTGLDRGLCRIADALLGRLAHLSEVPWERFTVLDQGEHLNTLADVIRLRFPDLTIWGLPIAAHEFGHVVASSLTRGPDGATAFRVAERLGTSSPHVTELFADAYATYALGPAYLCTCILARFDPRSPATAGATHPSPADRVQLCLDVLRRMNEGAGLLRPLSDAIERLESTWTGMVQDATGRAAAPGGDQRIASTGEIFWDLLELTVPGVRYRTWMQATTPVEDLLEAVRSQRPLAADGADLRDIVNTAWAARLFGPPDAVMPLADWGLRACTALVPTEAAVEDADR